MTVVGRKRFPDRLSIATYSAVRHKFWSAVQSAANKTNYRTTLPGQSLPSPYLHSL